MCLGMSLLILDSKLSKVGKGAFYLVPALELNSLLISDD